MYAQYGAAMLDQLRGMYAFAIWDEHEQQLFLARDPLGIKPLYYAQANGCLHFASQAKALLDVPGVDLSPQPAGHVGFFVWGSVPEPWTLYRGIFSCPSGTWILAGTRGIRETRQFASSAEECIRFSPDQIPRTEAECTERLHAALEESVRVHEIADVPVGIFLSAGIDSGMMASLASERSDRLEALTLGFDFLPTPAMKPCWLRRSRGITACRRDSNSSTAASFTTSAIACSTPWISRPSMV